jgi:hypothetical protein
LVQGWATKKELWFCCPHLSERLREPPSFTFNAETRHHPGVFPKLVIQNEVKETLRRMKNHKAPGPEGIQTELLKYAPRITSEHATELFNDCLFGEDIPEEWKLALIRSLHKKGNRKDCDNYRGIRVLASMAKLYGRIIKQRIEGEIRESEEQSGFRPGRSTADNIFCLKQIPEKKLARGREAHFEKST